jgi:hypothetical protein|tara:strand:+ start:10 stop:396 length:387 start_codon:yes stop_codon:yes gene_type:complete
MKKESSFKMKGFSGFGGIDPTKDVVKFDAKGGFKKVGPKVSKLDMTLNDKLNKAVRKKTATNVVSKKPASYASRAFRGFKNLAKIIGGRATGVAGMMMATTGTALGSNKSLKSQEGAARRLYNKRKKK